MASVAQNPKAQSSDGVVTDEERRLAEIKRTERERQKQALYLQRELVLSQRTSSPARRSALEAALAQIESQLAALE